MAMPPVALHSIQPPTLLGIRPSLTTLPTPSSRMDYHHQDPALHDGWPFKNGFKSSLQAYDALFSEQHYLAVFTSQTLARIDNDIHGPITINTNSKN